MIHESFYKRTTVMVVAVLFCAASAMAQIIRKHVVKQGETLEQIAKKYSVKKSDILEWNFEANKDIYPGMELQILSKTASPSNETNIQHAKSVTNGKADNSGVFSKGHLSCAFEIGYGFLKKPEGMSGNCFEYRATLGCNYFITDNLYAGARIGYNSSNITLGERYEGGYTNTKVTFHMLCLPLEVGYAFTFDSQKKVALAPFAGIDFNIGLKGKVKEKSYGTDESSDDVKIGGKIGVGFRAGLTISLWDWALSGAYVLPINDNQKGFFQEDGFPEITLGFKF